MSSTGVSQRLSASAYGEVFRAAPVALLVIQVDGLVMRDANPAYLAAVGLVADEVLGRPVLDVFPNSPLRDDDQTTHLLGLFTSVIGSGETRAVQGMRYDIRHDDEFESRWWNVVEVPLLDETGEVELLLHFAEDVTELYQARDALAVSQAVSRRARRRVTSLADVALALTGAETIDDLQEALISYGLAVLEAESAVLLSRSPAGGWSVTVDVTLVGDITGRRIHLPYDAASPGPTCARTGERVLLPDRATGLTLFPEMQRTYDRTGRSAWAVLPLTVGGRTLGALEVSWTDERVFSDGDLDVLEALAAQCAQTLSRIQAAESQRHAARQVQDLAEALQSAMLTEPPRPDHLDIAVRYRSAIDVAQVGGDWYDAFLQPDGATTLVIGDVVGHDHIAAGKMGQLRGLLRALAYDAQDSPHGDAPSSILTRFEFVARGLAVDELATAVLARVEQVPDAAASGGWRRVVRWSNAGNLPPVIVEPDGTTRLLDAVPDLILGVDPGTDRHDHVADLGDGCTLLLYTDGLVERRDVSIDDGIAHLCSTLSELAARPLGELCDSLLERLAPHTGEDDIAMIAVRG